MCGIAGYYGEGSSLILKSMTDSLSYRGPDDAGYFEYNKIGLGHRRLAIIDLSKKGHQPMSNAEEDVCIVFNGEIYNFQELRNGLKGKYIFKSDSDTEVIIHLYEEIGPEVFSKIRGMFAIALYDKKNGKLFLARDGMGKKPLYYGVFNNTLIFGSELKALLSHPSFKKELDINSLNKYFYYEYIPTPHTIFKNAYKLEGGHYIEFDGNNLINKKFWDISFMKPSQELSFEDSLDRLDSLMHESVKKRLMSDVPLGIFLSGGIDSSTIAYYAQKIANENNAKPIETFSIGFKENSFDESKYAREVASFLGTNHHEQILSASDSLELVPKITDLLDEPMADPSIIPTYLLSRFTRENVTVALGGDGGDELLNGYDTFLAEQMADIYEFLPLFLRKEIIEKIIHFLPISHSNMSLDFKAKKFISGLDGEKKYRHQRWLSAFNETEINKLFTKDVSDKIRNSNHFEDIDININNSLSNDYSNQITYLYLRMYMMDDILVKVDRASMYNSLEVRAPFLDLDLVEFLVNLPKKYKIKGLTTKVILKKLMKDKLPKNIIYRKKKGFGIPVAEWLSGELKPLVLDMLSEERVTKQGLFNYGYINELLTSHFSKQKDNRKPIWTLLMFQMWYSRWYL